MGAFQNLSEGIIIIFQQISETKCGDMDVSEGFREFQEMGFCEGPMEFQRNSGASQGVSRGFLGVSMGFRGFLLTFRDISGATVELLESL